jgi:hypothetical protein
MQRFLHHDLSATRARRTLLILVFTSERHASSHSAHSPPFRLCLSQPGQAHVVAVPQPVCGRVQVHPRAGSAAPRVQERAVCAVRVHAQAQAGGAARHDQPSWYFFRLIANAWTCRSTFSFFGVLVAVLADIIADMA